MARRSGKKKWRNWNEAQLVAKIARKYPAPAWAMLAQVRDSTGGGASRTADAIAMSLWPSRGLELHGFECKSSRSDWLNELKDPSKADLIQQFCHYWWVVTANPDIIKPGELPANWGHLVPHSGGLKIVKEAPLLEAAPPDHAFLAAILRRAHADSMPREEAQEAINKAREEGIVTGKESVAPPSGSYEKAYRRLLAKAEELKELSGVDIRKEWGLERDAKAIRIVRNELYRETLLGTLEDELSQLKRIETGIHKQVGILKEAEKALEAAKEKVDA